MAQPENPPAFAHGNPEQGGDPGMTLRDWFAGKALSSAIIDYGSKGDGPYNRGDRRLPHAVQVLGSREDIIARQAYRYADAMLRARKDTAND